MTHTPTPARLTTIGRRATLGPAAGLLLAVCLCVPVAMGAAPAGVADAIPAGMTVVPLRGIDQASYRAGSRMERGIAIVPVIELAFSRDWNPRRFGRFGLSARRIDEIRSELVELARQSFTRRLQAAGYVVPAAPSADALQLRLRIVDVQINAPALDDGDRRDSYVFEAGEMTLDLELRAAGSAEVLASMQDRYIDPGNGFLVLANEISNRSAAKRAFDSWADALMQLPGFRQ
ncbi:MAG: DUF3313 family protein [Gammaproteobacteria bacterium]|nr:DUF3313 family protein [Gammaproteobacteria bacterium]